MKMPFKMSYKKVVALVRWAGIGLTGIGALLIVVPLSIYQLHYAKLSSQDGAFTFTICHSLDTTQILYRCSGIFKAINATKSEASQSSRTLVVSRYTAVPVPGTSVGATYYSNGTLVQIGQKPVSFNVFYIWGAIILIIGLIKLSYYYIVGRSRAAMVQGTGGTIITQ